MRRSRQQLKTNDPQNVVVFWYGQSGNTERYAKMISRFYERAGFKVEAYDIRKSAIPSPNQYDLIIAGFPVYYYDIPENAQDWLKKIPRIDGIPAAGFVSYGGPEGNQHNAVCSILDLLQGKGGIPVGMASFMNMGTMPTPTWTGPGILEHSHLPDCSTYGRVRKFASGIIDAIRAGRTISFKKKAAYRECLTALPLARMTKWSINKHTIDKNKCSYVGCAPQHARQEQCTRKHITLCAPNVLPVSDASIIAPRRR